MTASLAPSPLISQQDTDGAPLIGGLLFTYLSGSDTPATTYTTSTGTVPNQNPITLDAYGQAQVWLSTSVTYRFQMAYPGDGSATQAPTSPIWTVDGITASSGVTSLGGVGGVVTLGAGLQLVGQQLSATIYRDAIAGLTLAAPGNTGSFSIAAGQAVDSTNVAIMPLPASLSKTGSAWAPGTGNGSLDTGSITGSTTYHVFLIQRVDTGATDILTSKSPSAPTMPPLYTLFRRIGSMVTDSGTNWLGFSQFGDEFRWILVQVDFNASITTTTPTLRVLTLPTGINVMAIVAFNCSVGSGSTNYGCISSPSIGGLTANVTSAQLTWSPSLGTVGQAVAVSTTNTTAQVYVAVSNAAATTVQLATLGWIDRRGRDA